MRSNTVPRDERGSVMVIMLVTMTSVGALALAHLTGVLAELKKAKLEIYAERAAIAAEAELEFAKNIVNAAPYSGTSNTALAAAMNNDPPLVPGTSVLVDSMTTANGNWFMLRARGRYQGITKFAQAFVRQRTPVSSYNFFVIDHKLGISGAPRGSIHSNESIDFYFPWGLYRDQVTAGEGFNYKAGATPENTRLQGPWNPAAAKKDILADVNISDLEAKADTLSVTDDLIAEIEFQGAQTKVDLFAPSYTIEVPRTEVQQVFDHYETQFIDVQHAVYEDVTDWVERDVYEAQQVQRTREVKHYDTVWETRTKTQNVYEWRDVTKTVQEPVWDTRVVTQTRTEEVWVEDPPPDPSSIEGGFAVGGEEPVFGHWETVSYTVDVEQTYIKEYISKQVTTTEKVFVGTETIEYQVEVNIYTHSTWEDYWEWDDVKVGTELVPKVRKVFSHYETVQEPVEVPIYRDVEVTVYDTVTVPEEYLRTEIVSTTGVLYFEGPVRSIKGQVNGQVSVVTNDHAKITDSITYVDNAGQTRMLNGSDPTQPYTYNPDYVGDAVLGIMSRGDILYALDGPAKLEINASLISSEGKVAFESISISPDGEQVSTQIDDGVDPALYVKESIRRLGGIVSRHRPVTTYVNAANEVLAGYGTGVSIMDRNLILGGAGGASPPFVFEENRPTWSLSSTGTVFDPAK